MNLAQYNILLAGKPRASLLPRRMKSAIEITALVLTIIAYGQLLQV